MDSGSFPANHFPMPNRNPLPCCQLAKDPQMLDGNDRQRIWTVQTSHSTLLLHALYSFKF